MLTDFGLSRMVDYSVEIFSSSVDHAWFAGSIRWMAYELLSKSPALLPTPEDEVSREIIDDPSQNPAPRRELLEVPERDDITRPAHSKAGDMWAFGMVIYVHSIP